MQRNLTKPVKFVVIYQTKKVSYFLSKKDKIPDLEWSDLVYQFSCPGSESCIGKMVRKLGTRLTEYAKFGKPNSSAISEHLVVVVVLHNLYDNVNDLDSDKPFTNEELIINNTKILHSLQKSNSNLLVFLEALHI